MLRTSRLASLLGVGEAANALSLSTRIPTVLADLLILSAIPGCFIPVAAEAEQRRKPFAFLFFLSVFGFSVAVTVMAFLFAEPLLLLFAPSLPPSARISTVKLLRLSLPTITISTAIALFTAWRHSQRSFYLPAIASGLSNLTALAVLPLLSFFNENCRLPAIALTLLFSLLLQVWLLIPKPIPHIQSISLAEGIPPLKKALKRFPSVFFASAFTPLSQAILFSFAGTVSPDGMAVTDYAMVLFTALCGLLVAGTVNVSLPCLARLRDTESFPVFASDSLVTALRPALPLSFLLCFLSFETVTVFYQRGQFSVADTEKVAPVFAVLVLALPFSVLAEALRRLAEADGTPHLLLFPSFLGLITMVLASFFFLPLGLMGIALAFLLSRALTALLLAFRLRRRLAFHHFFASLPPVLIGSACAVLPVFFFNAWIPSTFPYRVFLFPFVSLFCGMLMYLPFCRPFRFGRERRNSTL